MGEGSGVDHARTIALVALTAGSAGITAGLTLLRTAAARTMIAVTLAMAVVLVQIPWLARWLDLWSFRQNLDEAMVDELAQFGPVVALDVTR